MSCRIKHEVTIFSETQAEADKTWLANPSFQKYVPPPNSQICDDLLENDKLSHEVDDDAQPSTSHSSRSHKKKHKKDHKSRKEKEKEKQKIVQVLEFDGNEDYYVDKTAERGYLRVQTLHKPACPRLINIRRNENCEFNF